MSLPAADRGASRRTNDGQATKTDGHDDELSDLERMAMQRGFPKHFLAYPKNLLCDETGRNRIKNAKDSAEWWSYRKDRPRRIPKDGEKDVPADGERMLAEIRTMKDDLDQITYDEFHRHLKEAAAEENATLPGSEQKLTLPSDFRRFALSLAEPTEPNARLLYKIFFARTRGLEFQSGTVDKFLNKNEMYLIGPGKERANKHDRGGFGVIAREKKSSLIRRYMQPKMKKHGWKVAISTKNQDKSNYKFTRITVKPASELSEEEAKRDESSFYIVTDPNFGHGSGCHGKKAPALTASATVCLLVLLLLQNFLFPFFVLHSLRFSLNRFAFFILLC